MPIPWYSLTGHTLTIFGAHTIWLATQNAPPLSPSVTNICGTPAGSAVSIKWDHRQVIGWPGLPLDWDPWDITIVPGPWCDNCTRWFTPEVAGINPAVAWTPLSTPANIGAMSAPVTIEFPPCGLYTIRVMFCPQHHPYTVEQLLLDFNCPADANGDCSITIEDLQIYLQRYGDGVSAADIAGNNAENPQPDGGVDINDLLYFLESYLAGC